MIRILKIFRAFGPAGGARVSFWLLAKRLGLPVGSGVRSVFVKKLGRQVYLRPGSTDIYLLVSFFAFNGREERLEYQVDMSSLMGEAEYIVDAGANIGLFSLLYSCIYPGARVVAIEPEESNYQLLLKNVRDEKNIIPIKSGLWNRCARLEVLPRPTGEWGFYVRESEDGPIDAVCMDEIMRAFSMPRLDIVKMDIEGSEYEVFSPGCESWLSETRVIMLETHERIRPGTEQRVNNAMAAQGFLRSRSGETDIFYRQPARCRV